MTAFECDLTERRGARSLLENVPVAGVDFATLIFVLSAVSPDKMPDVVDNLAAVSFVRRVA